MTLSKAEQSFRILRESIMDGTYGPGHRLVIDQLVREHGISSVPWRESMRRLEAEGWVEIVPNVGALVKTFDTNSWKQTLQLLARLEGFAAALSAPNLSAAEIAQGRDLNRRMADALAHTNPAEFGRLNREFHLLICAQCGDVRLTDLLETEWARLELIRRSAFWYAPGRAQASIAEHEGILNLIEGGADPDMIETVVKRHELTTVDAVIRYEAELPDESV